MLAIVMLAWITVAWPSVVAAQSAPRVAAVVAATEDETNGLQAVLTELLGGIGVTLHVARAERIDLAEALRPDTHAAPALARVWIDLSAADEAVVLLGDDALERVLVRRVQRGDRSAELVGEEIGLIVVTAVETLKAGTAVGAPRAEVRAELGLEAEKQPPAPAPAPEPAPPPPPPTPRPAPLSAPTPAAPPTPDWRIGGALIYEGQGYAAEEVIVHGPGISLEIDTPGWTLAPGLMLGAQYRIPFERIGDEAGFDLQSVALRLHAYIHLLRQEQFVLRLHAGGAAEILMLEPFLVEGSQATSAGARTRVAPMARVALSSQLRLFGDTALRVDLAADVDIVGTRYVIQRGDELVPIVEPLRVRPSLAIGLATSFAGASLFPVAEVAAP